MANLIRQRTATFADEWQARDIPLSRSETRTVKAAAEKLGLPLHHAPSGRTVQVLLQECMNRSLLYASTTTDERKRQAWLRSYTHAKQALGQMLN